MNTLLRVHSAYTVYENALLFLLNIKHGASQLYLGRGRGRGGGAEGVSLRPRGMGL